MSHPARTFLRASVPFSQNMRKDVFDIHYSFAHCVCISRDGDVETVIEALYPAAALTIVGLYRTVDGERWLSSYPGS